MTREALSSTTTIKAPPEAVFSVLADPRKHAPIEGKDWVVEAIDRERLTESGQIFRIAMYHPRHPTRRYQTTNRVRAFDPPHAIAWEPGYDADDGSLRFDGWVWRYDLTRIDAWATEVSLSYDWSAVPEAVRERIGFAPFSSEHLGNALARLARLVTA